MAFNSVFKGLIQTNLVKRKSLSFQSHVSYVTQKLIRTQFKKKYILTRKVYD